MQQDHGYNFLFDQIQFEADAGDNSFEDIAYTMGLELDQGELEQSNIPLQEQYTDYYNQHKEELEGHRDQILEYIQPRNDLIENNLKYKPILHEQFHNFVGEEQKEEEEVPQQIPMSPTEEGWNENESLSAV